MSPMSHVGRRLLPPIFIPNVGHNQSASGIVTLTFLTKNVNNESAFFIQQRYPHSELSSVRTQDELDFFYYTRKVNLCSILVLTTTEQSTWSLEDTAVTSSLDLFSYLQSISQLKPVRVKTQFKEQQELEVKSAESKSRRQSADRRYIIIIANTKGVSGRTHL